MSNNILDLICCPNCQSDLEQKEKQFICLRCKSEFREKEGILILISKELEERLRS